MTNYDGPERREFRLPVSRETYVDHQEHGGPGKAAGSQYDIMACLFGKINDVSEKMDSQLLEFSKDIDTRCQCRIEECDKSFIRRAHEKIPLSIAGVISTIAFLCFLFLLIGLGIVNWQDVVSIGSGLIP